MSNVVGEFQSERGAVEVWAVAEAVYDETQSKLVILFGSSLGSLEAGHEDEVFAAEWLPEREIHRKIIPVSRAYDYAQDLFAGWMTKVKRTIPKTVAAIMLEKAR